MKASVGHIGLNLSNAAKSFTFWKGLLTYLGFRILEEQSQHFDATDGRSYLCIGVTARNFKKAGFHRKQTGLNHLAFQVSSRKLVDQFVSEFLGFHGIEPMYGGAREYPEYLPGYYAVYFEDPDRIKVEIVYEPKGN